MVVSCHHSFSVCIFHAVFCECSMQLGFTICLVCSKNKPAKKHKTKVMAWTVHWQVLMKHCFPAFFPHIMCSTEFLILLLGGKSSFPSKIKYFPQSVFIHLKCCVFQLQIDFRYLDVIICSMLKHSMILGLWHHWIRCVRAHFGCTCVEKGMYPIYAWHVERCNNSLSRSFHSRVA